MTCDGFGGNTNHKAQHGDPAIEEFSADKTFSLDLGGSGFLEPLVLRLSLRCGIHGTPLRVKQC